jgi:hypothetical protein
MAVTISSNTASTGPSQLQQVSAREQQQNVQKNNEAQKAQAEQKAQEAITKQNEQRTQAEKRSVEGSVGRNINTTA